MEFIRDYLFRLEHQIPEAIAIGRSIKIPERYKKVHHILFCGMGGSAISCDILRLLASERSRLFSVVQRGGEWPTWAGRDTLVVLSSYSGNTEEVLYFYKQAQALKCPMLIVTSGGKLRELALRNKIPYLHIPSGYAPRMAIGYLTFSLLPAIEQIAKFRVPERELQEAQASIRNVSLTSARSIAKRISKKAIYLYAVAGLLEAAALRWRTQIEENAKTLASHQIIPEMYHNEVEGWRFPHTSVTHAVALFLKDKADPKPLAKKRSHVEKMIQKQGGHGLEIPSQGKTPLARLFSLIAMGDCVSYELAALNHTNPSKIPMIDAIKKIR